jgi:trehalose 6-phosphate phosphatase
MRIKRLLGTVHPSRLLVASDFDGTLAEIVAVPEQARLLPAALDALRQLRDSGAAVAVISGRGQSDLERLVELRGVRLLGDYGQGALGPPDPALARFRPVLQALVGQIPGCRLEVKPGALAVHFRQRPAAGAEVLRALAGPAAEAGLEVRPGRMVVEILPRGWDKSRALEALVAEIGPQGVVFLGDDYGDRGCFEYLAGLELPHLGVGVASVETPPEVFAACDLVLEGPPAAAEFLSELARAARTRGRAGP